jgi:glycosyltransferase involved in cell wall biosynthesis
MPASVVRDDTAPPGTQFPARSARFTAAAQVQTIPAGHIRQTNTLDELRARSGSSPVLSVVVPVYNEEDGLIELHQRLAGVLDSLCLPSEVIYVNDGSDDHSLDVVHELRNRDDRVAIVNLSRNFGKEIALTAGLDYATGEAVVVIDADLQDPPEVIPQLIEKWLEGYDVVCATRRERRGETWLKRTTAHAFYTLMRRVGEAPIPENTGDFRLLNRRCIDALAACRERRRFMKGLFSWVGFKHATVIYDRDPRFAGHTKWSYWRLWNFAIEGITSFTIVPLKLATYAGLITAVAALIYAAFIVARTLFLGRAVPGYASLMVAILFLGGIQLIAMGVIGEYVGRIFVESKGRPLYLLDTYLVPRGAHNPLAARGTAVNSP